MHPTSRSVANLAFRAWLSLAALAAIMGALLFGCAGTLRYWHAWVYLALFFALSAVITAPVGLAGELMKINLVRGVRRSAMASGRY